MVQASSPLVACLDSSAEPQVDNSFLHPAIDPRFSTDAAPCATTFKTLEASWAGFDKRQTLRECSTHPSTLHILNCQTASQCREQKNITTKWEHFAWILCCFFHTPQGPSRNPLPSIQLNVVTCLDQHRGSPTWSLAAHAKYSMMLTFTVVKLISPTGSAGLKSMWDLHHIITSKLCYKHRWWYIYIYLIISCICIRTWIYQYFLPYFVPDAHGSFHIGIELGPQICTKSLF